MPEISDEEMRELEQLRAQQQQGGDPPQDPPRQTDPPADPPEGGGRGDDLDRGLSLDELRDLPGRVEERVEGVLTRLLGRNDPPPPSDPAPSDPPPSDPPPSDPPPDDPPPREPPPRPSGPIARRWWGDARG